MFRLARWLAGIACSAFLVSACGGQRSLDPAATAKYVGDVVFQKTGFTPVDIRCPSGIPATAGGRFRCHFTGPEGPYTAYLLIVKAQGRRAAFQLETQPASWPPPALAASRK